MPRIKSTESVSQSIDGVLRTRITRISYKYYIAYEGLLYVRAIIYFSPRCSWDKCQMFLRHTHNKSTVLVLQYTCYVRRFWIETDRNPPDKITNRRIIRMEGWIRPSPKVKCS